MAAERSTSSSGRQNEADRTTTLWSTRVLLVVAAVTLALFTTGWSAYRLDLPPGWSLGVEAAALHTPLLASLVLAGVTAHSHRPGRLGWGLIVAAGAFSAISDVTFLWHREVLGLAGRQFDVTAAMAGRGSVATAGWLSGLSGIVADLLAVSAAVLLARQRNHRMPFTWALDLQVAAAGGITYALLLSRWAGGEGLSAYVGQLAFGAAATLGLLQIVVAGAFRDRVIVALLAAVALRQVDAAVRVVVLSRQPGPVATLLLDPAWTWVLVAVALGLAVSFVQRPPQGWSKRGRHPFNAGSWTVPALCMGQAVIVLVGFARRTDPSGTRPTALVAWAGVTLALGLLRTVLSSRDVERLGKLAAATHTDELSGLLNRRALAAELARATGRGPGALLLVDIDRFRDINQYLGHQAADDVLRQFGDRLRRRSQADELLGRLGADEFAVVTASESPSTAMSVARRVRTLVDVPFQVGGDLVRLDLSVGVATWDATERPAVDQLLGQAHEARRQARARGTAIERWDPERDTLATRRLALADSLRRSVRRHELQLHYQPKLNTTTGHVVGVEALARWEHDGEMVAPDLFISMAEEGGLIADLTRSLLDQALSQLAAWDAEGLHLQMAVNLSPRNLLDPALPRRVTELLARHRIAADRLVLEITETTLMPDRNHSAAVLERLRKLGVRLSIDDYGTGHAALAYLRDFAVDELKLDRSYVATMLTDQRTYAIVESTVSMGRRLGLSVVAEGVERPEEVAALASCGCEVVQGYLVSPALPAERFVEWLREREPWPSGQSSSR